MNDTPNRLIEAGWSALFDATVRNIAHGEAVWRHNPASAEHWLTWLHRTALETPVTGDIEVAANTLLRIETVLRRRHVVRYVRPEYELPEQAEGGFNLDTNTLWVLPGDPRQMLSRMLHEGTHAMLLSTPLGMLPDTEAHEVIAEAVAYIVCRAHGIDTLAASAAYVAPYLYQSDACEVVKPLIFAAARVMFDLCQESEAA